MRGNTMHEDSTVLSLEGHNIEVSLNPPSDKDLNQCDIAKLMRVGDYAPWNKESSRYWDKGNDVLYQFCEKYPLPKTLDSTDIEREEHIFASKMWLIGRSYAASPERYAYGNGSSKPIDKNPEGYESFFGDIARTLFEEKAFYRGEEISGTPAEDELHEACKIFRCFLKNLSELNGESYDFTENSKDIDNYSLLDKTVNLIRNLMEAIRLARYVRDRSLKFKRFENEENLTLKAEDQFCSRSFSSKFLHFHYPKLIFIYDGIAGSCLSPIQHFTRHLDDGSTFELTISPKYDRTNDRVESYRAHATKELAIAKAAVDAFVNNDTVLKQILSIGKLEAFEGDPIPCYYSITRMVDAVVSNAKTGA